MTEYLLFDHYQRYKTVQLVIDEMRTRLNVKSFNILEVGANRYKCLEKFLTTDKLNYSDISLSEEMRADAQFFTADATNMPEISSGSYDIVIGLDVFEHIPQEKRSSFIKETTRVSKYATIICFPFDAPHNIEVDINTNEYFRLLGGESHEWLTEHIKHGLPSKPYVEECICSFNLSNINFEHGSVETWETMLKIHFHEYFSHKEYDLPNINNFYNNNIYFRDVSEKNYRTFFVISDSSDTLSAIEKFDGLFNKGSNLNDLYHINKVLSGYQEIILKDLSRNLAWHIECVDSQQSHIESQFSKITQLDESLDWYRNHTKNQHNHIEHQVSQISQLEESRTWHEEYSQNQQTHIEHQAVQISQLEESRTWHEEYSQNQQIHIEHQAVQIAQLEESRIWYEEHFQNQRIHIECQEVQIIQLEESRAWYEEYSQNQRAHIEHQASQIFQLEEKINQYVVSLNKLQEHAEHQAAEIADHIRAINKIQNTYSWRATKIFRTIAEKLRGVRNNDVGNKQN